MMNLRQPPVHLIVSSILLAMLLLPEGGSATRVTKAKAAPVERPSTQGFNYKAYLPIVGRCLGGKCLSGVHLGNRVDDWASSFLQRIDPAQGGTWPAVVVVLSDQVYQINRYPDSGPNACRISDAIPRPGRAVIWDYLRQAGQNGVRIIIRVWPSPGNFPDGTVQENWGDNHRLRLSTPAGPNGYCDSEHYRTVGDISDELNAIHTVNVNNGFSEFGFEPANEPNTEWYSENYGSPRRFQTLAWLDMDAYFSAIYGYVHINYGPNIRVLTPPMAQSARAEGLHLTGCGAIPLLDGSTGYEVMRNTYSLKNDGINWHNYWVQGRETYTFCQNGGMHVSLYFPQWMKDTIVQNQRPATVTEADLYSPQLEPAEMLIDKESGANPMIAAESIRHFIYSENYYSGFNQLTASWLLVDNTGTAEHDWHKAISDTSGERQWFGLWYSGQESWP